MLTDNGKDNKGGKKNQRTAQHEVFRQPSAARPGKALGTQEEEESLKR